MLQRTARILQNVPLAERTYRVRLECPDIAAQIVPGQFVMLRLPHTHDPLLARPFALYDTVTDGAGQPVAIDIVYLVVGKMTGALTRAPIGERLSVWGPLGNGFPELGFQDQINLVAGGIGQTPFLALARNLLGLQGYGGALPERKTGNVSLYYGVRSVALAAGVRDFESANCRVHLASDDGTLGFRGRVTQLLEQDEPSGPVIGCGPEPMLQALAQWATHRKQPCFVSLETPMACGFGACFSCVTRVKTTDGWDYKRVCYDGPVFDASVLEWQRG